MANLVENMKLNALDSILRGQYDEAAQIYTRIISAVDNLQDDERSLLFSGRAACYLLAKSFQLGLQDCEHAISINQNNMEAYIQKW